MNDRHQEFVTATGNKQRCRAASLVIELADQRARNYKDIMGGPCVGIILATNLDDERKDEIRRILQSLGPLQECSHLEQSLEGCIETTAPIGGTYTGAGRSYGVQFVLPESIRNDEDRSADWCARIKQEFGLMPIGEIAVWMDCNDREDHRVLGELSLHFARRVRGLIDFDGALMPPAAEDIFVSRRAEANWSDVSELTERMIAALPGQIVALPYETVNGRQWAGHVCTPDFMAAWLQHPLFHMIK
jgi:hypothetical protein